MEVNSPKQVIREAGAVGIINNVKLWIEFVNKRNLTVHTYNELALKEVMSVISSFKKEVMELIERI